MLVISIGDILRVRARRGQCCSLAGYRFLPFTSSDNLRLGFRLELGLG